MLNVCSLKKRSEFVRLNESGRSWVTPAFVVLVGPAFAPDTVRYGITASRKIGGAVQRNRAKRRLRAVVDAAIRLNPTATLPAMDVVLIARHPVLSAPFADLQRDFNWAMRKLFTQGGGA
jgi:ribonuclease P protein component